jgi:hypothetical protein
MPIATLPKPLYEVGFKEYRRQHLYTVGTKTFISVTKILGIIGGGKTNALMIWARREALKLAKAEILGFMDTGEQLNHVALDELMQRADRQPDKIKDSAADLGTRVHNAIDAFIMGKAPTLDPEAQKGFENFMTWLQGEELEFICGDVSVASVSIGYGGRLDAIARRKNGRLVLLDWKTSNALRDEYPLQVAAYAQAFKETYGLAVDEAIVVRFGKDKADDFEPRPVNLEAALTAFKNAFDLNNSMTKELWA